MIGIVMYRIRIGCFNSIKGRGFVFAGKGHFHSHTLSHSPVTYFPLDSLSSNTNTPIYMHTYHDPSSILAFVTYIYFMLILMASSLITIAIDIDPPMRYPASVFPGVPGDLSLLCCVHIQVAYFQLISFALLKAAKVNKNLRQRSNFFKRSGDRFGNIVTKLMLAIMLLNFLLIGICNPSLLNPGPNSLKVSYQNVQGLIPFSQLNDLHPTLDNTKIFELNSFINQYAPDVLLLNETWLKKSIKDEEIIDRHLNYKIFRSDRSQVTHPSDPSNPKKFRKNGGGVLIAVKMDIEAEVKRISMRKGAEIVSVEVKVRNEKLIFCSVYRVGTLGSVNHDCIMSSLKSFYGGRGLKNVVIAGDFNLSSVSWPLNEDSHDHNRIDHLFIDSFDELGLLQCIEEPTHIKGRTLDLLLTNNRPIIRDVEVLKHIDICKSDHYALSFSVITKFKRRKSSKRKVYNFKRANWDRLNQEIGSVPWEAFIDGQDPELAWTSFKDIFFRLVERNVPRISISEKFTSPWFDSECYEAYRSKERAHKNFKLCSNIHNEVKRDSSRKHFKNICSKKMRDNLYNNDDPALITKKFWSHVKSNSKSQRIPECIHLNGRYRTNAKDKADLFNDFFADQFSGGSEYGMSIDWTNDEAFHIEFTPTRIKSLLSNINSNKACGPDSIHGKLLKHCANSLCHPFSLLFTLSYNTGYIPREWKLGNVVPVHKKGSKDNVENYRPISLTSLVMKTFERIIKDELLLKIYPLLDNRQHGFLNSKSCTTNMVLFSDSVVLSINDCNTFGTDVVYFDFSKAFDSVNHDLILLKLKHYFGIEGRLLKFIENYLCGREQCVVIENEKSSNKTVLSGVPQGSILGPILFVLFINDLPTGLDNDTNLALYADDTKIWRPIKCDKDHDILQKDIDYLNNWAIRNKMKFHPQKCKVVSLCNRESRLGEKSSLGIFIFPLIRFHYHLGGVPLEYADSEKDLGILINPNLNFTDHHDALFSKANQQFGLLKRTCHFVKDIKRKRALYLTLVRSQFEHCSPVWRPSNKTSLEKFDNFQKKAIKWILAEEELSYHSYDCYVRKCRQVNILPLSCRFDLNDLILFHKVVNSYIPLNLPPYLTLFNGETRLRSTHLDNLCYISSIIPKTSSSSLLSKSFFYRTHSLWNSLPLEIRSLGSLTVFRSRLETYFWQNTLSSYDDGADPDGA